MSAPPSRFSWARMSSSSPSSQPDGEAPHVESPDQQHQPRPVLASADPKQFAFPLGSPILREPTRSFIPGSFQDHLSAIDSAGFARSVRADTAELASYILADKQDKRGTSFLAQRLSRSSSHGHLANDDFRSRDAERIEEVSEPVLAGNKADSTEDGSPSTLTRIFRSSRPEESPSSASSIKDKSHHGRLRNTPSMRKMSLRAESAEPDLGASEGTSETTPLLSPRSIMSQHSDYLEDLENQKPKLRMGFAGSSIIERAKGSMHHFGAVMNPKTWNRRTIWETIVMDPLRCLPAVIVGLLLNILDALSYGLILFPLGNPIFAHLGPAGISMFYVSTIVAQVTFSTGSIFKGGVGSELIEVVPFFHSMAATITNVVGEDKPDAVIATTITSFAISSMLTGVVFYLMGRFQLGYIIGFIPRHILIGCIGGVGWFLIATGLEVSARLSNFNYDLDTARRLIKLDTLPLWIIPLALAVFLLGVQRKITSRYLLPSFILCIPLIFYIVILSWKGPNLQPLREQGWIFQAPEGGQPWWYFWTLYKFNLVHWGAILETVGAMFALTFFSLLHVPINVPALAQNAGEDHLKLDHELKLHGVSNFISGLAGSIQNYLVFSNTIFFMRSGGGSRLAGLLLAILTFVVMTIGPVTIGFIPVMMVGTLIFVLGFELLSDALVTPRRKLKLVEYLTILIIVLTMGIYDFVVGIFIGMILAFVAAIFHSSTVSAIRATYTGDQVGSMVRRNPSQHHYLRQVGTQTYVMKLTGFLFFGTIVGVEEKIRKLISDDAFRQHSISFIILDLWHVTGIDFSAAEGFKTISRLLHAKGVRLLISGKDADSRVGLDLTAVGLGSDIDVKFMPDLNSALESCENEQLKTLYANQEALRANRPSPSKNIDVPNNGSITSQAFDIMSHSPRRHHLHQAARNTLTHQEEIQQATKWQSISEPLRLMLQVFNHVSREKEDFWFRAKPYFGRKEFAAGTVLYHRGEEATGFYLLEKGELHAEYETPQGYLSEPIVQGTTCGELPFFSETTRTATVRAVKDCVVWVMDTTSWNKLQDEERDVAQELLRVSLKLTTERMEVMTNYISAVGN